MDTNIPNPNPMSDSEVAALYTELENYVSSTGGRPLAQSHSFPGDGLLPPAQHHHNTLGDIPPVQNTPNIWFGHFDIGPQHGFGAELPYEQFQVRKQHSGF